MTKYNPYTCHESIEKFGTYICRISCTPCNLYFEKKCEKEKMDDFVESIAKYMHEEEVKEV